MNKKGKSGIEMIVGLVIFLFIIGIFLAQGIFSEIIRAFSIPEFGGFGLVLGILFVLIIIISLLDKIIGK